MAEAGQDQKAIADSLGVNQSTISRDLSAPVEKGPPPTPGMTIGQAAEKMGRGAKTVQRAVAVQQDAPELLDGMKSGLVSTHDAYRNKNESQDVRKDALDKVKDGKSKTLTDAVREVKRERNQEESIQNAPRTPRSNRVKLFDAKIADAYKQVEAESVNIIVTDPPYPKEWLWVWKDLADFAVHALKPGGILAALSGQAFLPDVFANLKNERLQYRWIICYYFSGNHANVRYRQLHNYWKPILLYHKDIEQKDMDKVPHRQDFIEDKNQVSMYTGDARKEVGTFHMWGQSVDGFKEIIKMFSGPGDVICDPFLGSGTTALATLEIGEGRKFIGSDILPKNVEITRGRVGELIRKGMY